MAHSYTNLLYHIVFSTKERTPWITDALPERLYPFMAAGIRDEGGIAFIINGIADHVHILARLRQDRAIADVIRNIKANSSGWIHKTFPDLRAFAWQEGYGAFTVSQSQKETVHRYIARQEAHHKKQTFSEEFVALLKAHGVEYDERYLWK